MKLESEDDSSARYASLGEGTAATTTALSSTTEELFRIWVANCLKVVVQQQDATDTTLATKIPTKATAIQLEARNFFASLVAGTTVQVGETVLQTRASHSDALALLIRSLEPCFASSASLAARLAALHCLVGAIQGCRLAVMSSLPLIQLLSSFLLQHAGPIAKNSSSSSNAISDGEYDEQIRDAAVIGLTSLLQCTAAIAAEDSNAWLKLRLSIAKSGVERRCAQDETDDDDDDKEDYYGYQRPSTASGLSLLPRSRRSLCFDLIRAAVDAVASTNAATTTTATRQQSAVVQLDDAAALAESTGFCKFVASCLHGESDPRCLLQLLQLFDALLDAFKLVVGSPNFPISEIFDAVAPYYPIQFNPPPNDAHGITRASLRQAVLRVLSCTFYDLNRRDEDNMASLSCSLILESLVPPPEDGPPTFKEQFEALEDLQIFLFATGGADPETNCDKLDADEIKHISDALLVVHETSSLAVSRGEDTVQAKALADLCRSVVANVAIATERMAITTKAWQVFVEQPVRQLATRLDSSVSGRVSIAYIACLASSGGAKTLHVTLEAGLAPLLKRLEDSMAGEEDAATALYGIGAFFSSCRAAMEKSALDGVHWRPHPLRPYCNDAVDRISRIIAPETNKTISPSVQVAAVRALESILLPSPADLFADDRIDRVATVLRLISSRLLTGESQNDSTKNSGVEELLVASSLTLGTFLGRALDAASDNDSMSDHNAMLSSTVLNSEQLRGFLQDDFFRALLASVKIQSNSDSTIPRHDRMTLALAASYSLKASSRVVQPLTEALYKCLLAVNDDTAKAVAETLSFLFERDQLAAKAYQESLSPAVTALEVMASLAPVVCDKDDGMEADFGMSGLQLPKTTEDRERSRIILEKAYGIIRLLRKGYEVGVTSEHFEKLVTAVNQGLPPLSDTDTIKLSIALPFLSAAMESSDPGASSVTAGGKSTCETLRGMAGDLADFAMAPEHFPSARLHAGRCLHAAISLFTPRNAQECPVRDLTKEKLMPSLTSSIDRAHRIKQQSKARDAAVVCFLDSLSILALLGSAAAFRGGPSSKTSDQIVLCLVDLACTKKTGFLFTDIDEQIELSLFDTKDHKESTRISIRAASAFGSILSTESGHLLWKQRLTHISLKRILECINSPAQLSSRDSTNHVSLGLLAALCHLLCSSDLKNTSANNLERAAEIVAYGLSPATLQAARRVDNASVTELVLAALVKLLSVSPSSFRNIYPLITGTMRAYATASDLDQRSEIACKLLALQALAGVAQMGNSPEILKTVRPAVVSLLGTATNHPSALLRHAAVEVRNAWFVIE